MASSVEAQNASLTKLTPGCGGSGLASDGDPVAAAASNKPDCDLRLVCHDGSLTANRCVLCRASSVLRQTLGLQLPTPGELQLQADSVASWEVVLNLLNLEAYPLQLVNMDNVAALLVLADKYDVPIVRGACAHFLHINAPQLRLDAPLASAANILTAVSLVAKFCSTHPSLEQYGTTVRQRLEAELAPLRRPPDADPLLPLRDTAAAVLRWHVEVLRLVSQLEAVVKTEEYVNSVAGEVQLIVSGALLAGLRYMAGCLPPLCQRCNAPLLAGADAMHADCAESHYSQLHTKGCRLCGVAMPPSHARFCNSCAYRRNK